MITIEIGPNLAFTLLLGIIALAIALSVRR